MNKTTSLKYHVHHRLVAELDQRLGKGQGQGPETSTETADED
jgi:hypothetical protein